MIKKYLVFMVLASVFSVTGLAQAATNCDGQAKPAFDCPTGYSMMCIPVGGDHWGCGKESNGVVVESSTDTSASTETSGVKSTMQTQVKVQDSDASSGKIDATAKSLDSKIDSVNATSERVLPTVNKVTSDESSQRLLPTVNKRTIEAKITVRGWDPEKKEAIINIIEEETQNNPAINSVDISEDAVAMDYSAPAKFLGFIPLNIHLNIFADADARVKVKFPWYRFLITSSFSNAEGQLNEVFQHNQTDLEFLKSQATQERQVEIFLKISNTMEQTLRNHT